MQQVAVLSTGSLPQRVAHAILAGAILGVEEAEAEIDALRKDSLDEPATAAVLLPEIEQILDAVQDGPEATGHGGGRTGGTTRLVRTSGGFCWAIPPPWTRWPLRPSRPWWCCSPPWEPPA